MARSIPMARSCCRSSHSCSFVYLRFSFALTPLQQFYLPYYVRSGIDRPDAQSGQIPASDGTRQGRSRTSRRPMMTSSRARRNQRQAGKQLPLELSPAGISKGLIYVYQQPKTSYPNKPLNNYFQSDHLWRREPLGHLPYCRCSFRPGNAAFQLPFSIAPRYYATQGTQVRPAA